MKNITTREQYDALTRDKILGKKECPFCDLEGQSGRIMWKGKYWYVVKNLFPYSGTEKHIMVVPYIHKILSSELSSEEFLELKEVHDFVASFFGIDEYFSCTRESIANRSIEHIHMHFVPGRLKGKFLRKMLELQGFPITEDLTLKSLGK